MANMGDGPKNLLDILGGDNMSDTSSHIEIVDLKMQKTSLFKQLIGPLQT